MDSQTKYLPSFAELIERYDNFVFDCDGVIWKGDVCLEVSFSTLNKLKELNKNIFFITNNSAKSRKEYHQKFIDFGFDGPIDNIYPLSYVGPDYIKNMYPNVKKLYALGMKGLMDEIKEAGFELVGGSEDNTKVIANEEEFMHMKVEEGVDAVILGFDMGFNYYKMTYASLCIQKGAHFLAISNEAYDIIGDRKIPGGGVCVSALERATGVAPVFLGKPNKYIIDSIIEKNNLDPKKTLMTGDRMNVDILLGKNGGVDTCLVLTGVTNKEGAEAEMRDNGIIPDYICEDMSLKEKTGL